MLYWKQDCQGEQERVRNKQDAVLSERDSRTVGQKSISVQSTGSFAYFQIPFLKTEANILFLCAPHPKMPQKKSHPAHEQSDQSPSVIHKLIPSLDVRSRRYRTDHLKVPAFTWISNFSHISSTEESTKNPSKSSTNTEGNVQIISFKAISDLLLLCHLVSQWLWGMQLTSLWSEKSSLSWII